MESNRLKRLRWRRQCVVEKRTNVMLGGRGLMALLALQVGGSQPTEAQEEGYGLPLIEEIRVRVE